MNYIKGLFLNQSSSLFRLSTSVPVLKRKPPSFFSLFCSKTSPLLSIFPSFSKSDFPPSITFKSSSGSIVSSEIEFSSIEVSLCSKELFSSSLLTGAVISFSSSLTACSEFDSSLSVSSFSSVKLVSVSFVSLLPSSLSLISFKSTIFSSSIIFVSLKDSITFSPSPSFKGLILKSEEPSKTSMLSSLSRITSILSFKNFWLFFSSSICLRVFFS